MFLPTTFPILIPLAPIIAKTLHAYFTYSFSELNLKSRKTSVNYEEGKNNDDDDNDGNDDENDKMG